MTQLVKSTNVQGRARQQISLANNDYSPILDRTEQLTRATTYSNGGLLQTTCSKLHTHCAIMNLLYSYIITCLVITCPTPY